MGKSALEFYGVPRNSIMGGRVGEGRRSEREREPRAREMERDEKGGGAERGTQRGKRREHWIGD